MLRRATATDVQMQKLKQTLLDGWPDTRSDCHKQLLDFWNYRDEITYIDGILLNGKKVIIPKECRKEMLEKIHESHLGIGKCTPVVCGKSLPQLLFSRQLRSTLPVTAKQLDPSVPSKSALRKKMQTSQTKSKHYYDRSAKPMKPLNPGCRS